MGLRNKPSRDSAKRRQAAAAIGCLICAAALGAQGPNAPAQSVPPAFDCRYVEAGAPGPEGNVLQVEAQVFSSSAVLYRDGARIRLFNAFGAFDADEFSEDVPCSGPTATVTNVDAIQVVGEEGFAPPPVVIDQSGRPISDRGELVTPGGAGGPLAPGATPEGRGSEIEVSIVSRGGPKDGGQLYFVGGAQDDFVTVGSRKGARPKALLNLNSRADRSRPDVDVTGPITIVVLVGNRGDDRFDGTGQAGLFGKLRGTKLVMNAGPGDDVLLGNQGRNRLVGGEGDDLLRAGRGDDGQNNESGSEGLYDGPGNDRLFGGAGDDQLGSESPRGTGSDLIFGGSGADTFHQTDRARDRINCGRGIEYTVQYDHRLDRLRGCEPASRE